MASSGMSHEEVVGEVVDHLRLPWEVVCKRVWQTFVARLVARFTLQPRGKNVQRTPTAKGAQQTKHMRAPGPDRSVTVHTIERPGTQVD